MIRYSGKRNKRRPLCFVKNHHLATIRNTSALGLASLGLSLAPLDEPDLRGEPLGVLLGGPLGEARRLLC